MAVCVVGFRHEKVSNNQKAIIEYFFCITRDCRMYIIPYFNNHSVKIATVQYNVGLGNYSLYHHIMILTLCDNCCVILCYHDNHAQSCDCHVPQASNVLCGTVRVSYKVYL